MPAYGDLPVGGGATGQGATALIAGQSLKLWNAETPAAAAASIALATSPAFDGASPAQLVFTATWATTPTVLQIDIQASNEDIDAKYQTVGSITTLGNGYYADYAQFAFYRGKLVSNTTGAGLTLIARR